MRTYSPFLFFICIFISTSNFAQNTCSIRPQGLRCEYLDNPQGLDVAIPRLSWTLSAVDSNGFGQRQTAYRILVSHSQAQLANRVGDVWDSGWISSAQMQLINYKGIPITSDKDYYWEVCVKDEHYKVSDWSAVAKWTTGLLKPYDWTAKWIGTGESADTKQEDCTISDPWLRKTIELKAKPSRAMMFVASVGYHELYVNGKKIGNDVLSPCVSDHLKRARYVAYDISGALKPGKNVLVLWLGTSWSIFSSYATDDKPRAPLVIAQADLYENGKSVLRIKTDASWKTHASPNRLLGHWEFGHMGGELWDAGKEKADWDQPACDTTDWKNAVIYQPRLMLTAQMVEPNRVMPQTIYPIAIEALKEPGSYRVDMGVNFAGWTEIKLKGTEGQRIDLLYSERGNEPMTFQNHNAYIPGRGGNGVFKSHFNYSSGRWITIKGLQEKPLLSDVRGWVVRTNYQPAASFVCSDSLQNWIYDRVRWNFENLSIGGYVVDCPQRERLGYGGDAHATSETGMNNYQLGAFYTKWMEDWRDVQGAKNLDALNYGGNADDGILPHAAPTYQGGGGPGWGGICVELPWLMYEQEGDTRVLQQNFGLIKNWLTFLDTHTKDNLLLRFGGAWDFLGDWLWPGAGAEGMNNDKPENKCFNNCYRVYNLRTAVKIARVLGRKEESLQWEQQANAAAKAIQQNYYQASDHSYADSSMGNLAAALLAEVPPANIRAEVMKRLEKEILVVRKGHIHVGITGGAMLFKLLRQEGRDDLLFSMTSQTDYPGWGYMKANGATSLWEMWEKDLPGHSLLHSSYLYPGAWYIDGVGGIRTDPERPGFQHFIVRPPLLTEQQISWAITSFQSSAGLIKTSWKRAAGGLVLQVSVPPGTTADVYYPSQDGVNIKVSSPLARKTNVGKQYTTFKLIPGNYQFSSTKKQR